MDCNQVLIIFQILVLVTMTTLDTALGQECRRPGDVDRGQPKCTLTSLPE